MDYPYLGNVSLLVDPVSWDWWNRHGRPSWSVYVTMPDKSRRYISIERIPATETLRITVSTPEEAESLVIMAGSLTVKTIPLKDK